MANKEHLDLLRRGGVNAWNEWRKENVDVIPDLSKARLEKADLTDADLSRADLTGADLSRATLFGADLTGADLTNADLMHAVLFGADLTGADLTGAKLFWANLTNADLTGANLFGAHLGEADLTAADLIGADLTGATLVYAELSGADANGAIFRDASIYETKFIDVDLTGAQGLDECDHAGPSTIDHRTLMKSGSLPVVFLRGCGLPDKLIEYLPTLLQERAIQFFSCFISYSSQDDDFARRLHEDLQDNGVRCWFAPEDMKIGDKILDTLDQAIRLRDKLMLVLSEASIGSDWVEDEVTTAFAEERRRDTTVLFPIRLDDAVMETDEPWAAKLRDSRHIGEFTQWKDHDSYKLALDRLLRDLAME